MSPGAQILKYLLVPFGLGLAGGGALRFAQDPGDPPRGTKLTCPGCRFRLLEPTKEYTRGVRIRLFPAGRGKAWFPLKGVLGTPGLCLNEPSCPPIRDCRYAPFAFLLNRGTEDLWFQAGEGYVAGGFPGIRKPDGHGWVRVPKGEAALFAAGWFQLGCGAGPWFRHLWVFAGPARNKLVAHLTWAVTCTACTKRDL